MEIEKAFDVIELPERLKARYITYMLVEDAETWWHMQLAIKYENVHPK